MIKDLEKSETVVADTKAVAFLYLSTHSRRAEGDCSRSNSNDGSFFTEWGPMR